MNTRALYRLLATGVLGLTLYACTENPSAPIDEPDWAAAPSTGCDLIQSISSDTRSFFPMPERKPASDAVSAMSSACKKGLVDQVADHAWGILSQVDALVNAGRGGAPAVGSNLVNGLLACTKGLCLSADLESPLIDFQPAFSPYGLFGVRTGGYAPVLARNGIPFGGSNSATWVVESDDWKGVMNGVEKLIIFGSPLPTPKQFTDVNIEGLQYDLAVWPDRGPFADGSLHVGTCFAAQIDVPHPGGDVTLPHLAPVIQRENVLLEVPARRFSCDPSPEPVQQASLANGFAGLIRGLLPAALRAVFMSDLKVTVIGGSPLDFSTFAVMGADPDGYLTMLQGPNNVVVAGQSIGDIKVGAYSGAGTPAEKVKIILTVYNNSGVPAGAELTMPRDSDGNEIEFFTSEADGTVTISGATLGKAGGYIICAEGTLDGFTFAQACSQLFQARNQ